MSERVQWIEREGTKVLVCDFSHHDEKRYLEGVYDMEAELLTCKPGPAWPLVVDVMDSTPTGA
jgi:hypothetical protein